MPFRKRGGRSCTRPWTWPARVPLKSEPTLRPSPASMAPATLSSPTSSLKSSAKIRPDLETVAREYGPCDIVFADIESGTPDSRVLELVRFCDEISHAQGRSEEHTSELQSLRHLVCRLL